MGKKKTISVRKGEKQPEWVNEICDTCRFAAWVTEEQRHLDLNGKPICLRCPNYAYYIVRGRRACAKWQAKTK